MEHTLKAYLIFLGLVVLSFAIGKGVIGAATRHACIEKDMTPEQCADWYERYDRLIN